MRSQRIKKMLFIALCGGTLLQAASCSSTIASLLLDLVLQYGLSALLGGIVI
jgi:hypothetical protein